MSIEVANVIQDLNAANPPGTDPIAQGDDHIRLLKAVLKTTFPDASQPMPKATTALAQGGVDDTSFMTPLKTKQAIQTFGGSGGGSGTGITIKDEGSTQGNVLGTTILNFVGGGVSAVVASGEATITIPLPSLDIIDESTDRGQASTLKFTGAAVDATVTGGVATINFTPTGGSGITGVVVKDDGTSQGTAQTLDFTTGISASFSSGTATMAWTGCTVQDEGSTQGSALAVQKLNFAGAGVSASVSGDTATITVSSGAGAAPPVKKNGVTVTATPTALNILDLSGGEAVVTDVSGVATLKFESPKPLALFKFGPSGTFGINLLAAHRAQSGGIAVSHPASGSYHVVIMQDSAQSAAGIWGVVNLTVSGNLAIAARYKNLSISGNNCSFDVETIDANGTLTDSEVSVLVY